MDEQEKAEVMATIKIARTRLEEIHSRHAELMEILGKEVDALFNSRPDLQALKDEGDLLEEEKMSIISKISSSLSSSLLKERTVEGAASIDINKLAEMLA